MILVLGLLALAFFCLTVGGSILYWIGQGHPQIEVMTSNTGREPEEIKMIMVSWVLDCSWVYARVISGVTHDHSY
jgi:hypothetical protein